MHHQNRKHKTHDDHDNGDCLLRLRLPVRGQKAQYIAPYVSSGHGIQSGKKAQNPP